jgi:hypothetical protein
MIYNSPVELYSKISPLLQEPLSTTDMVKLKEQLSALDAIRYELSYTRCEWLGKLLNERERMRVPRDKEYTEFDRATMLGSMTSMIESDYEFLQSLEVIIKDKIDIGKSILN